MDKKILLGVAIALFTLTGCNNGNQQTKETASPSFDEVLTTRRSIRAYDATKKISEAEVRELLLATQEAPSWANLRAKPLWPLSLLATGHKNPSSHSTDLWKTL